MLRCAFCDTIPTELSHWCLLEKRDREEAALLEELEAEEKAAALAETERYMKARVAWYERRAAMLERASRAEG